MKVGQMGFSSILCCGWFLLMMLHSPVYSANERQLGSPKNVNDLGNGDKADMQSFKIGRKFGLPSEFSTGKYLAVQRRLLGDNATRSVGTERIRAEETIRESVKNQTNSEIKAESPLPREMQATNDTIQLKEKENLEIVENEMHNKTGENNSVAKSANKDAERLSNSTTGGVGVETPTNSTEIGIRKMEGNEARSSANHTGNLEPAGSLANSTGTEIPKMQSTEANRSPNSTDIPDGRNSTDIDMQRMQSPTDIETQTTKISEAGTQMANSSGPALQGAQSILAENSTNLQNSEGAKGLTHPSDGETPNFQNNASPNSANVTDIETAEDHETPSNSTDVEMQDPGDEYSDLMQDLADLPSKLQDTAEKVADQLMPGIQRLSNTSKVYLDIANQGIAETFSPLIGKQYAPAVASAITCILLLLPIILAIALFEHVRAFFPLQKVVFLANIYLANYFATLVVASFIVGMEPMVFFHRNSLSGYICLQLVEGLGYALYVLLQCLNAVVSCSHGAILARAGAALQCTVSICIGLHYYVTVFHRAMAQKAPRTCWKVHGTYALLFLLLCLLSKPKNDGGKKEYLLDGNTNKKN